VNRARGENPDHARPITPDEIDQLLDRELPPAARRELTGRLRHDPAALDELTGMHRVLGMLREPVPTPDLAARVLGEVDRRRGFLSSRLRRRVRQGRALAACVLLLAGFSVAMLHRADPGLFRLRTRATPVGDLGEALRRDSLESRDRLAAVVRELSHAPPPCTDEPALDDRLAVFHVEADLDSSPSIAGVFTLTAIAGEEFRAARAPAGVAMFEWASPGTDRYPRSPIDPVEASPIAALRAIAAVAFERSPPAPIGVMPLMPTTPSASFGRLDALLRPEGFGGDSGDERAVRTHPGTRSRVSSEHGSR
jgi:hypothetical protein